MSRPFQAPATENRLRLPRWIPTVEERENIAQEKLAQSTAVLAKSTNTSSETQNLPAVYGRPRLASLRQGNKDEFKFSPTKPRPSEMPAAVVEQLSGASTTSSTTPVFTPSTKESHASKPPIRPSQLPNRPTTAAVSKAPQPPQQQTTTLAPKRQRKPPRPRWFPPVQSSISTLTPPATTTQPLLLPYSFRPTGSTMRSSRPPQRPTLIMSRSRRYLRAEPATTVINTTTTSNDDDENADGADSEASANTTFSRRLRRRARAERDLREDWVDVGEAYGHARRRAVADRSPAVDSGGSDVEGRQWEELDKEKELEVSSFEEEKERKRMKKEWRAERRRRIWEDEDGLEEDEEDSDGKEGDEEIDEWEEVEKDEARQLKPSLSALKVMDQVFKTLSKL